MPVPLPPQTRAHAYLLLLLTALIGIIGLVILALLALAWRRFNARFRNPPQRTRMPDIWQAGGERLVNELDQSQAPPSPDAPPPPPPPPDGPPGESTDEDSKDDDDDDEDDDDPEPWQKN